MHEFYEHNKINTWPMSTNIFCWWCCHQFNTIPVSIPLKIHNNTFEVYGCFCSYNCAMAYIFKTNSTNCWEHFSLLKLLRKKMTTQTDIIKCAPPKEILDMFGGTISIEKYRDSFYMNNISYRYIIPPMISIISQIIEEKKNILNKINKKNTDTTTVLHMTSSYKLKRDKPLINSQNSLETTMGIKIK